MTVRIPKFATETEEAKWWYENRELISDEFQKAAKEGRLKRGGIRRLFAEKGIPFKGPTVMTIKPGDTENDVPPA